MAVGANEIALHKLKVEQACQSASGELGEIADLLCIGAMVEGHSGGVETFAAIHARSRLQLAHPRDEARLPLSLLPLSKLPRRCVVHRVPRTPAGLAPPLMPVGSSMKLAKRLLAAAEGAAPERGHRLLIVHMAKIEQAFDGDKRPVGDCRGGPI